MTDRGSHRREGMANQQDWSAHQCVGMPPDSENVVSYNNNNNTAAVAAASTPNDKGSTLMTNSVLRKSHYVPPSAQQYYGQMQDISTYHQTYTNSMNSTQNGNRNSSSGTGNFNTHHMYTIPVTTSNPSGIYRQSNSIYKKEVPFRIQAHVNTADTLHSQTNVVATNTGATFSSTGTSSSTGTAGYVPLTVNIESSYGGRAGRASNLTLRIELTNEAEPCFLFSLDMCESDYRRLKQEQRLLVEFEDFASSIISLLEECTDAASEDHLAKINCIFSTHVADDTSSSAISTGPRASASTSYGKLRVVEENQFKELTHLCLVLVPGDDPAVQRLLTFKLSEARAATSVLAEKCSLLNSQNLSLSSLSDSLQNQMRICRHKCDEQIRVQTSAHAKEIEQITRDHLDAIKASALSLDKAEARGVSLSEQLTASKEAVCSLQLECQTSNKAYLDALADLEAMKLAFNPLKEAKQVTDSQNEELSARLDASQHELSTVHSKLGRAEATAGIASSSKHAVVSQAKDLESKLGEAAREIKRGNEIIAKQRSELKALKSRQQSVTALEEKVKVLSKDLSSFEATALQLAETRADLNTANALLNKRQHIIETLNKQLTAREVESILQSMPSGYSTGGTSTDTEASYFNHLDNLGSILGRQPSKYTLGDGYPFRNCVESKYGSILSGSLLPDRPATSPADDYGTVPVLSAGPRTSSDPWPLHTNSTGNTSLPCTAGTQSAPTMQPTSVGVCTGGMSAPQDDELFAARPAGGSGRSEDDPLPVPVRHYS